MMAAGIQSLNTDNLPFGWFDGVVVILIIFGLFRGRKNGMTRELLPLLLWLGIVSGGAAGYAVVGQIFINNLQFSQTKGFICGYLSIALLVSFVFMLLKQAFHKKLNEGTAVFGGGEYYFGMISGMIRYVAVVLFLAALLNAPYYSAAEIQARQAYNNRTYGGGLKNFSGDFIPNLQEVQDQVFRKSLAGPFIKDKLDFLLIETVPAARKKAPAVAANHS